MSANRLSNFVSSILTAGALAAIHPAQAGTLRLVPGAVSYDASGFVHISGEIHNDTGHPVCSPEVEVVLEAGDGKPIAVSSIITATKEGLGRAPVDSVVAERFWLPAGEVAVFTYLRDVKKLGGRVPVEHELRPVAGDCPGPVPTVRVEGFVTRSDDVGSHQVAGTLRNVGQASCRSPKVVLGLYDAAGMLIDATSVQPDEMFQRLLPPGGTVSFARPAIQDPDTGTIARIETWGDCDYPE